MKRPLFFWTKNFLRAYAKLHLQNDVNAIVEKASESVRNEPLKYYVISILSFFFFEFIFPIFSLHFLPFSYLSEKRAQHLVVAAQNHRFYPLRLAFLLCKTPVLCALQTTDSCISDVRQGRSQKSDAGVHNSTSRSFFGENAV